MTELVASFIGVSQQPGDKGQPKCHDVSISCPCADANARTDADIQSSGAEKLEYCRGCIEADREVEDDGGGGGGWGRGLVL